MTSFQVAFKLILIDQSMSEALDYYIRKDVSTISSSFLFQMLKTYKDRYTLEEHDQGLKKFISANISKLVVLNEQVFLDKDKTYEMIKNMEGFRFEFDQLHYLE